MDIKSIICSIAPSGFKRSIRLNSIRKALYKGKYAGYNIQSVQVSTHALISPIAEIWDQVYIGDFVSMGAHSYIQSGSRVLSAKIGKFCSIGTNCHIGMFEHPVDNISTSSRLYLKLMDDKEFYRDIPSPAIIGNDVWIGSNATILGGLNIGDGAVIGAGAVVTKDVPPYAIVGGVPARVIRYRFDQKKIDQLETIAWWNWDDEKIKRNQAFFEANKDEVLEEIQ